MKFYITKAILIKNFFIKNCIKIYESYRKNFTTDWRIFMVINSDVSSAFLDVNLSKQLKSPLTNWRLNIDKLFARIFPTKIFVLLMQKAKGHAAGFLRPATLHKRLFHRSLIPPIFHGESTKLPLSLMKTSSMINTFTSAALRHENHKKIHTIAMKNESRCCYETLLGSAVLWIKRVCIIVDHNKKQPQICFDMKRINKGQFYRPLKLWTIKNAPRKANRDARIS